MAVHCRGDNVITATLMRQSDKKQANKGNLILDLLLMCRIQIDLLAYLLTYYYHCCSLLLYVL